jgi:hypothetical protein
MNEQPNLECAYVKMRKEEVERGVWGRGGNSY